MQSSTNIELVQHIGTHKSPLTHSKGKAIAQVCVSAHISTFLNASVHWLLIFFSTLPTLNVNVLHGCCCFFLSSYFQRLNFCSFDFHLPFKPLTGHGSILTARYLLNLSQIEICVCLFSSSFFFHCIYFNVSLDSMWKNYFQLFV